jgi:hypothetical protein
MMHLSGLLSISGLTCQADEAVRPGLVPGIHKDE